MGGLLQVSTVKSRCGVWYTVHVSAGGSVSVMAALTSGALADWRLADIAACAAGSHLNAIELTVGPNGHVSSYDAAQEAELGRALATLDGAGLALCGVAATGTLVLGHPDLGPYARLAASVGAEFMRVFPAAFSSDSTPVHQISSAALALAVLAAEAPGIRILVEMSPGSVIPSPELALRVLELSGVDDAGVVYDPANLIQEGHLQPSYAVALLGERIGHVHVKNRRMERAGGTWVATHAPIDDGMVDWPATLEALWRNEYRGALAIDHLSGAADARTLRADASALTRLISDTRRDTSEA